jgi:hypothetical protein
MCIHDYVRTYVCMYVCMLELCHISFSHMCVYVSLCVYTYVHACIHTYVHTFMQTCIYLHTYISPQGPLLPDPHILRHRGPSHIRYICIYTRRHTYTDIIHIHTYMHTYIYTHTYHLKVLFFLILISYDIEVLLSMRRARQ